MVFPKMVHGMVWYAPEQIRTVRVKLKAVAESPGPSGPSEPPGVVSLSGGLTLLPLVVLVAPEPPRPAGHVGACANIIWRQLFGNDGRIFQNTIFANQQGSI